MKIHRGQIIEKLIRRDGHSITEIALKLNINRRSLYNWFTQKDLKQEIIYKIGHVIQHDFSVEFPELFTSKDFIFDVSPTSSFKERFYLMEPEEQSDDVEDWRAKYIDLLEKFNELLSRNYNKERFA